MREKMISKPALQLLYRRYNRRKYVHPDPLEFLYRYPDIRDREIAGLVASSLAYGRVAQILRSVSAVLDRMGPSPRSFLIGASRRALTTRFAGFKHRFTTDGELVSLLLGARRVIKEYGSLGECFVHGFSIRDANVLPALRSFAGLIACDGRYLIPDPAAGSACKRLNLFLRWMVRKDAVDPGGWDGIPKNRLIVPLDTHMARIGAELGLTARRSADIRMAIEITESFGRIEPDDPVKYDFVLTRYGIRNDMDRGDLARLGRVGQGRRRSSRQSSGCS